MPVRAVCRCRHADSNYVVRASALAQVGWFPTYTAAEGHALGMALQASGLRGAYLAEDLAAGQGPRPGRELLRQRARWARGHMQVGALQVAPSHCLSDADTIRTCTVLTIRTWTLQPLWSCSHLILNNHLARATTAHRLLLMCSACTDQCSVCRAQVLCSWRHCPLLRSGLPLAHRLWYCHAAWSHLAHVLLVPAFVLVPLVSVAFSVHPVLLGWRYAAYATAYYGSMVLVQSYCSSWAQLMSIWYSQVRLHTAGMEAQGVRWLCMCLLSGSRHRGLAHLARLL